jgi:spoIIIJ-associated protein
MMEDPDLSEDVTEPDELEEGGDSGDFEPAEPPDADEVRAVAEEFVGGLVAALGVEAEVSSTLEGQRARIDIGGENLGILIGRKGQTLDALQEITRTAVQRRFKSRVKVLVDVEGYRERRRQSLVEYAQSMAQRAIERGTEIELEPMSSYERRVVHQAVAEIEGATSFSEGEEPLRKVVIRGR